MTAERVHGILGYYDGVLDGVADFEGSPHAFVIDGDLDAEFPRYRLKRLTDDQFAAFLEYWQMWRRWEDAFYRGEVLVVGAPAVLPDDRSRHDEIDPIVKEALAVSEGAALVARGAFRRGAHAEEPRDGRWGGFEVVWTTP
jgi:hypothetical protein